MTTLASGGRMPHGSVPGLILLALEDGALSGGDVARWLAERTAGGYTPGPGSIYPRLGSLDLRGLVSFRERPGKLGRAYKLTRRGQVALDADRERLTAQLEALKPRR